jgi:hypothetical protein
MRPRVTTLLLALSLIPSLPVGARAETADGIVERLRSMVEPVHDRTMRLTMHVRNASGGEDLRSLRGFEKKTAEGWKLLYVYDSPADLAGTSFLTWTRRSEPDLLWAYFPAQARVRQLPKPGQQTRFQGSDFSYQDLRLLAFDYEAQHRLEGEAACGDARCYVMETALPAGTFPYETLRSWLRTDTLLPDRVEFRGRELLKVMRVLRTGRVSGIPTLLALEMETPDQAHRTTVDFDQVAYNTGIDESFFSTARLSRMDQ